MKRWSFLSSWRRLCSVRLNLSPWNRSAPILDHISLKRLNMQPSRHEYIRHFLDETKYLFPERKDLIKERSIEDETVKRACVRSIEIIGEASKKVPSELDNFLTHMNYFFTMRHIYQLKLYVVLFRRYNTTYGGHRIPIHMEMK